MLNTQQPEKRDHDQNGSLDIQEVFFTLQGEGPFAGTPAVFVRTAGCNLQCPGCFHGPTPIRMGDGSTKPISEVRAGDVVLSYSKRKKKFIRRRVTTTMVHDVSVVYRLTVGSRKVFITGDHPILVKGKGWVAAKSLQLNDIILHLSVAEQMRIFNPMKDAIVAGRVSETMKTKGVSVFDNMTLTQQNALRKRTAYRMRKNNPMKNPETAIKGFLNRKDRGRRTKAEAFVENLGTFFGLRFVGDGSLVVNHKVPDFIIDGTKKLVEVWDAEQTEYLGRDEKWQEERRRIFESAGYEVLFLPITPFPLVNSVGSRKPERAKKKQAEANRIVNRLAEFVRNGLVVRGIERITSKTNPKAWTRLAGSKDALLPVFNFEVQGTHTYIAAGMIVHNCDTDYTSARQRFTVDELLTKVHMTIPVCLLEGIANMRWIRLVVITGGEPFRQNLTPFVRKLLDAGYTVQVETNGTIHLNTFPYSEVTIVCSPKTPTINAAIPINAYKYVLDAEHVSPEDGLPTSVLGMAFAPARPFNTDTAPVYLQPMDEKDHVRNMWHQAAVVASCMKFGYRFCLQTQKLLGLP